MKNIRYWGNQALPGGKKGAKWGQNANYQQFHYGNAIYSLQVEQNRYISSLQIYLDSVKWKIFVTGVTKQFQGVKKGAKWGQNANYRQFHLHFGPISAPVKFLRETGVSRPGILVVRGLTR